MSALLGSSLDFSLPRRFKVLVPGHFLSLVHTRPFIASVDLGLTDISEVRRRTRPLLHVSGFLALVGIFEVSLRTCSPLSS